MYPDPTVPLWEIPISALYHVGTPNCSLKEMESLMLMVICGSSNASWVEKLGGGGVEARWKEPEMISLEGIVNRGAQY